MTYLESFTKRFGEETIKHLLEKIKSEENSIRGSYDESTEWIPSEAFVDLIFLDSVFIMEFSIKLNEISRTSGDQIVDNDYTRSRVIKDLILLENQLPYFIFEIIFGSIVKLLCLQDYAARVVLDFFSLKIKTKTTFKHFTDMFRCVYEESLDQRPKLIGGFRGSPIKEMPNAANLSRAGVEFKVK
ncbi:unnamed protein product [Microthlaspi erraticum]|uniref:Uncharacterized protein n=1 Tax=Microthlaspi erraticum TaxID=1685480 RepID=A0A6D2L1E7_9BRAS|nr:unnamed protein product [Microthlaspi erraticum]